MGNAKHFRWVRLDADLADGSCFVEAYIAQGYARGCTRPFVEVLYAETFSIKGAFFSVYIPYGLPSVTERQIVKDFGLCLLQAERTELESGAAWVQPRTNPVPNLLGLKVVQRKNVKTKTF